MTYRSTRLHDVSALLLRRTDFGDSDLVLLVFTDSLGVLPLLARGARKSQRRFAGGIEPFHQLAMVLSEPQSGELFGLREARLSVPRLGLLSNLSAMNTAGRVLAWLRHCLAIASPEPELFRATCEFLDQLNTLPHERSLVKDAWLCHFGLVMLQHLGWALELERCVRCGKPCPMQSASMLDPRRGGLVCRNCGGGPTRLSAELRSRMHRAQGGEKEALCATDASIALAVVEQALRCHPGVIERS